MSLVTRTCFLISLFVVYNHDGGGWIFEEYSGLRVFDNVEKNKSRDGIGGSSVGSPKGKREKSRSKYLSGAAMWRTRKILRKWPQEVVPAGEVRRKREKRWEFCIEKVLRSCAFAAIAPEPRSNWNYFSGSSLPSPRTISRGSEKSKTRNILFCRNSDPLDCVCPSSPCRREAGTSFITLAGL